MKKISIPRPCSIKWDEMTSIGEDKYCSLCERMVYDLDKKTDYEIKKISRRDKVVCGKISSVVKSAAFAITITITSCTSITSDTHDKTELNTQSKQIISGKVTWQNGLKITPTELYFITKKKLYKIPLNSDQTFEISLPTKEIRDNNLFRIYYNQLDDTVENKYNDHVFSKQYLNYNINVVTEDGSTRIGGLFINNTNPPDVYFLDGKRVSKANYNNEKSKNPHYHEIVLYKDYEISTITSILCNALHLLYSE